MALDYGSNQDKRTGVILVPFLIFLFGAALGVASKLLDIYTSNLGNIFSKVEAYRS